MMSQRKAVVAIAGRQRLCRAPSKPISQMQLTASVSFITNRPAIATTPAAKGLLYPLQTVTTTPSAFGVRRLSTEMRAQTAAAAAANASMASEAAGNGAKNKKKAESNVFLDNIGKIFLMGIGGVIVTLVRSSYNTSNRHVVRDRLEEIAAIDPKEIEDFREANSELTLETMRQILSCYYQEEAKSRNASGVTSSYDDFIRAVRNIMATRFPEQGESFTIQMGHYLDRIVVAALEERGKGAPNVAEHDEHTKESLPVALFFVAMASAMNGTVSDRIQILHEIMAIEEELFEQQQQEQIGIGMVAESSSGTAAHSVPITRVRDMVGYLQETCQLPPDTQIVPTDKKYPTQQWRRATPMDMVPDVSEPETGEKDTINLVEFAAILRTKSVCAWGECYMKWKPDASEFETTTPDSSPSSPVVETSIVN